MEEPSVPVTLPTQISDLEFHTVMDTGFFGAFAMTPSIHSHPYYELIAAIHGGFIIEFLNGDRIEMSEGTLCLIPPRCYHLTNSSGPAGSPSEKLAVRFSYRQIKSGEGMQSVSGAFGKALTGVVKPVCFESVRLCEIMTDIRGELNCGRIAADVLVQSYLQQLYINLIRFVNKESAASANPDYTGSDWLNSRYYRIEIYFSENYQRQITEEDLARELKLSKRQLSRMLREIYGMSFREKLIDTRLHTAAKLLSRTDIPVEKIAYMVGYETASGFFVTFKKRFGMSGGEYRKQSKKKNI